MPIGRFKVLINSKLPSPLTSLLTKLGYIIFHDNVVANQDDIWSGGSDDTLALGGYIGRDPMLFCSFFHGDKWGGI